MTDEKPDGIEIKELHVSQQVVLNETGYDKNVEKEVDKVKFVWGK